MDYTDAKKPAWTRDWWNIRPRKVADVLQSIDAKIVGLNEVFSAPSGILKKQHEQLADMAGYKNSAFGKAISLPVDGVPCDYGNALLSKFDILETQTFVVPSPTERERRANETLYYEDRAILRAVIDVGTPITVLVTHFGLNLQEMERMTARLIEMIDAESNPVILMGDFNTEPSASVLAPIFQRLTSVAKACNNTQKTFATFGEQEQIDHIFVSAHFQIKNFERVEKNVSDHYPCAAELILHY
ncbi:MAG: endonuclease/exonuclease/phosphatase family protein [Clostridia bacterium]|nr:endonuclease/exonuclease/phosphatase family protein [Clostridia bacterium]